MRNSLVLTTGVVLSVAGGSAMTFFGLPDFEALAGGRWDFRSLLSLLGFLFCVAGITGTWRFLPRREQPKAGNRGPGLEERIDRAHARLREGAELVEEVSAELETRRLALERLRIEHEQYERLAALDREQAQAVARLVEATVEKGHQRAGRAALAQQMWFFALGLVAGPLAQWAVTAFLRFL
ncbi:hypothetical protein ACFPZ0_00725 [Streptomonospora nanhaiensis]|uniref:Uncharacterized protein n=1 Tax=Streptomonospora nanhaiensis TaxID=1323731 RepID=A0A853BTH2_9ACTN|nr:hypothetical protein [Streptomonospora nanhaiensis]MBV2366575.1 hypothetical protein [Streptomonospora nanhaiensis]MBX9386917.1 hypothetical protein [Streptomonospora nanhaiensis]NYI98234.1 hypothetical protein [Streptomonospora nanhaiensis]